jgi:8-oxo-dGTP pyrophosphatase MutT (NUDIX family)
MDEVWAKAVQNPALFDGPVAVCAGLTEDGNGRVVLEWARTTYRNFALRLVEGARSWLPSLFVAVAQPTDDRRLLVGRMGGSTAAPGRWQLPGGTVDPPTTGAELTLASVGVHAALELGEEIGMRCALEDLSVWTAVRCPNGNIGVLFRAPHRPWRVLREGFEALRRSETEAACESEFVEIDVIASPYDLATRQPVADYLPAAVDLFFERNGAQTREVSS